MFQIDSAERCPEAVDVGSGSGDIGVACCVAARYAHVGTVNLSCVVASAAATDSTHGSMAG